MPFVSSDPVGLPGIAALAVGFAAFLIALLAAKARSSRDGGKVSQRAPGAWFWIAVQAIGIGIAAVGPIRVAIDPMSGKALGEAVLVFALMLAGVALFDTSSRAMGKNWAVAARTREDHTLVESGPFRLVRNPIYVALSLFMVAIAVAYGHLANLIVAVPVYALGTWMRVRHEERLLRDQFGAAYDAYAARVKRFVPGLF